LIGAAIMSYHKQGGLNKRSLLFHSSGDWKSKIKVIELVTFEDSEEESI
jgi:hypothetical protein